MDTIEKMTHLCLDFKEKKYDIEEFQSRLECLLITDEFVAALGKVRFDAANRLEEIRFCYLEEDFYKLGVEVADGILDIINGLKN